MTTISRRLRLLVSLSAALAAALTSGRARAAGFLNDQFGSDHGQPALGNAYSVYFNPAAMAGMTGSQLTLDGVAVARSMEYDRDASALSPSNGSTQTQNPTYQQANTGTAKLFNVLGAPYVGFVTDFGGSHLRLGVASYVPFGGEVSWQKNQAYADSATAPGAYDGPQRWQSISTTISSLYETAALAYRFDKARLGIGASFSVIRTGVTDVRARNLDGSDDILTNTGALKEGRAYLDVSGLEVGAAAGIYWEPKADGTLRLGASYTSQPNFGTMRLKGSFRFQPGALTPNETVTDVDLLQAFPDVIRAGMAWRLAHDAELRVDVTWERWSEFKNQCVVPTGGSCAVDSQGVTSSTSPLLNLPRDWQDSVKGRVGGSYWITPETEVFASFALGSSPVGPSNEDALTFDSARLDWTLGGSYQFSKHVVGQLAYSYVYFLPVTVTSSAYPSYPGINQSPSANGSYSSEMYVFDAAVSYLF